MPETSFSLKSFRWAALILLAGIAAARDTPTSSSPPDQRILIDIPQTEASAISALKLFDRYPSLRMVMALSPRFRKMAKDPTILTKIQDLKKKNRIELALQLPNAPFLPLIINTSAAQEALPPPADVPNPPFRYPDDVIQLTAKAKSDFTELWGDSPQGLVLPYGAVTRDLLTLLGHLGFNWSVGALGMPAINGSYQAGSLKVWDGIPSTSTSTVQAVIWDERVMKSSSSVVSPLAHWGSDVQKKRIAPVLPSDNGLLSQDLPAEWQASSYTWTTTDWQPWIGTHRKNDAWDWLRKTHEALDAYKNSGQATVRRLDMTNEEMYAAENAAYFAAIGDNTLLSTVEEEREQEFKATLNAVYRLMGQASPDDLFSEASPSSASSVSASTSSVIWEQFPDGHQHLGITDPEGDDHGNGHLAYPAGFTGAPGSFDLRHWDVTITSTTLDWAVTLGALTPPQLGHGNEPGPLIDIYIDLNHQPNAGTTAFLPQRGAMAAPEDAWEYALCLYDQKALLYQTHGEGSYELVDSFPLVFNGNTIHVQIPRDTMRGNPERWGYQVLIMAYDPSSPENNPQPLIPATSTEGLPSPIYDLLDSPDISQTQLLHDIESGKRNDVPFVRAPVSQ